MEVGDKKQLPNGLRVIIIRDPDISLEADPEGAEEAAPPDSALGDSRKGYPDTSPAGRADDEECGYGSDEGDEGGDEGSTGSDDDDDDDEETPSLPVGPATKKAAVAMSVHVGSFSDPVDIPGLSHYLEHMLFMGSEAFPTENEYDRFLTQHGGSSNAYTDAEHTVFFFDVAPQHLRGALARFAGFFTHPLCLASSMEREVEAVDHEFRGQLQSDSARGFQLLSHGARP